MQELRGAIIGAGYFAGYHAEAWRRIPGVTITAACDALQYRAREFAAHWGIPRAYDDPTDLLRAECPDFVDLVTRTDSHLPLARLAAGWGAHVICQKPLAPDWGSCLALVEACEKAGVRLLVHENWRWQPWYREIRRLLDAGALGTPFHLSFRMRTGDGRGPEPYPVQPYFRELERFLVLETVVHFLDTFRYLAGEIDWVFCRTERLNPAIRGEDYALIQLGFASGAHGLIDANRISGPMPAEVAFGAFRLEGDRGLVRLSPDGSLWVTEHGQGEAPHAFPTSDMGYKGDSARAAQEHYVDSLRLGTPAETEGREYLKTMAAAMACYRSAEAGERVELGGGRPDSGGPAGVSGWGQ